MFFVEIMYVIFSYFLISEVIQNLLFNVRMTFSVRKSSLEQVL